MKVDIVIGAGHGDEGKGVTTDWLLPDNPQDKRVIVVRSHGSCQAGHTVEYESGRRTIYQHLGSGMARGVPTYLSEQFVVHPMLFRKEFKSFNTLPGVDGEFFRTPQVFTNSKCLVTTPWDMLINQCMERSRSTERHGSVGIGFGETIERNLRKNLRLTVRSLRRRSRRRLEQKLIKIRNNWLIERFKNTNFQLNENERSMYFSPDVLKNFLDDCEFFLMNTAVQGNIFLSSFDHVIFEGAQGLMLDQDYGKFPYVTRSNTGLKNPMEVIRSLENLNVIEQIDVYYISRSYATRHGAGPLPFELRLPGVVPFSKIEDKTNVLGEWQGSLRFGYLNLDELNLAIRYDINKYADKRCKTHGVFTCVDQIGKDDSVFGIFIGEVYNFGKFDYLLNTVSKIFPFDKIFTSNGPTKNTFRLFTPTPDVL